MLKPSVCIDAVFEGIPSEEAAAIVADCGISAVEFWGWWDRDLKPLLEVCSRRNLAVSACCTRFTSLVDAGQRSAYLAGLQETVRVAQDIGAPVIISQVGDELPAVSRDLQRQSLIDGLKAAADILADTPLTLAIEPLNLLVNHPGYYLVASDEAFEIVDAVGSEQIRVLFDIYHQQVSEGHVMTRLQSGIDRIAHFHAAGNPGRHELTRGELNYPQIFDAIRGTDFDGYVALEYWPQDDPAAGLREVVAGCGFSV